jgi:hypothetical protein
VAGATDIVQIIVEFDDDVGAPLSTVVINDSSLEIDVFDWNEFVVMPTLPAGTRTIVYTIRMEREVGGSTDAFADNLSLVLGCPADCDFSGTLSILDFICFQSLFQSGDLGADINQDGALSIVDFITFQTLFQNGCG